ncbi:DinB family protein [Pseudobacillus sp. 179-B 2D1 NHS]|uniref:DinB family protein n=1 Tax=Pseudobacillus sp. 179-B 2D1 NHS TaxID=3374292 RepID=UPI00387A6685
MEKLEYEWVKQTRNILLDQCKELTEEELIKELDFGFQSIKDSFFHIAGCYHAWLGSFVLSATTTPLYSRKEINQMQLEDIKRYFQQADAYVEQVFEKSIEELNTVIEKKLPWRTESGFVRKTPHQLLVHSITHEFHHKGQIVAMLRLLGYVPQNTDILGLPGLD